MAGGKLAAEIPCMVCMGEGRITKAKRIYEGVEDDQYICDRNHEFGVDYSRGPATEPQWPPPQELVDAITKPA